MTTANTSTIDTGTAKKTEIKWSTKYNDDDADVELVSSDEWHFKVHSYRLQTISPVFRSMLSIANSTTQRIPIAFTDDKFEVGVVIRLFLDGVYSSSMEDCADCLNVNSTKYIVDFARKWECQGVLDMIELVVRLNIRSLQGIPTSPCEPFDLFLLAVKFERYELAGECLRVSGGVHWDDDQAPSRDDTTLSPNVQSDQRVAGWENLRAIDEISVFDLSSSHYLDFLEIPPNIVWALMRANRLAKINTNGKDFEDNLGEEFVKLMRLAYPLSFAEPTTPSRKRGRDEI